MIESLYEFIMNMPEDIRAIYTADITQCYERIPLEGCDNLHEALEFVTHKGFSHHNDASQKHSIWVHINTESGLADHAKWDKKVPNSSCWIEMTYDWVMTLQSWLINNCYIRLGDEVW